MDLRTLDLRATLYRIEYEMEKAASPPNNREWLNTLGKLAAQAQAEYLAALKRSKVIGSITLF